MAEVSGGLVRRCRPLLGTFVEIAVPVDQQAAIGPAFDRIAHIHACMSFHEETSDLARLREAGPGQRVAVDPETVAVLRIAEELHRLSGGIFDVGLGARLVATGYLPRPPGLDLRRMSGTAADIDIIDECHIACRRPMLIDLGGIAKGHAVDRAIESLVQAGVRHAIVNAGGDLRVIGSTTVHLRGADGDLEGVVELADAALASSSNLHLRRRHRGREHAPHLGSRRLSILADRAVSVIADRCVVADAMTKVAMASPPLAARLLQDLGGAIIPRARIEMAA